MHIFYVFIAVTFLPCRLNGKPANGTELKGVNTYFTIRIINANLAINKTLKLKPESTFLRYPHYQRIGCSYADHNWFVLRGNEQL